MWLDATSSSTDRSKASAVPQLQVIDPLVPELFESGLHGNRQHTDRRQTCELAAYVGTFCLPRAEFHTANEPQNSVDRVVSQGDARKVETFMEESHAFADRSRERYVVRRDPDPSRSPTALS